MSFNVLKFFKELIMYVISSVLLPLIIVLFIITLKDFALLTIESQVGNLGNIFLFREQKLFYSFFQDFYNFISLMILFTLSIVLQLKMKNKFNFLPVLITNNVFNECFDANIECEESFCDVNTIHLRI